MPATTKAKVTDGPDRSAIAAAVRTKRPAPMIAPMPSATRANGPRVRFNVASPLKAASVSRRSIDLVRNRLPAKASSQFFTRAIQAQRGTHGLYAGASLARQPLDRDLRKRPRAREQRRPAAEQLLIEILPDHSARDLSDPLRRDLAEDRPIAERAAPERHVAEIQMPRPGHVDAVVARRRAAVNRVAGAQPPGPRRIDHQERSRHLRVDHRPVLRDAVQIEPRAAPAILDAELRRRHTAHRVSEDPEARQIDAGSEPPRRTRRRHRRQAVEHEPGVGDPPANDGVRVRERAEELAGKTTLLVFVAGARHRGHRVVFRRPLGEDVAYRLAWRSRTIEQRNDAAVRQRRRGHFVRMDDVQDYVSVA